MTHQRHSDPVHTPAEFTQANIEMLRNLAVDLTEANRRLYALRIEASRKAFSENSRVFKSLLDNVGDTSSLLAQWSTPLQAKLQSFTAMGHHWVAMTSDVITGVGEAVAQSFTASGEAMSQMGEWRRGNTVMGNSVVIERRVSASIISFPDRRAVDTGRYSAESAHRAMRKKHAA